MKISLITVVYNRERTIERAIQSVLSQTYPDIEYIVVDGGSNDGTVSVVNKYKDKIHRFISERDNGMYDALNKGIHLSTGDVIGILHADDEFASADVIEKIANHLIHHPTTDAVYGDVGFVKEEQPDKIVRYYSSAIFKPSLMEWGFIPAHPTFYCYRKFFDQLGGYRTDLHIAADFDLLVRFIKKHKVRTAYLPEMLVKMNLGGRSTDGLRSTIRINKELKQILKEQELSSSYFQLYARYFIKVQEYWKKRKRKTD